MNGSHAERRETTQAPVTLDLETPALVDAFPKLADGPKRAWRRLWDAVQFQPWETASDGRRYKTLPAPIAYTKWAAAVGKGESQARRDLNAAESAGLLLQARYGDGTWTPTIYDPRPVFPAELNELRAAAGEYQPRLPGMDDPTELSVYAGPIADLQTRPRPDADLHADLRTYHLKEHQAVVRGLAAHLKSAHARPIQEKQEHITNPTQRSTLTGMDTPKPTQRLTNPSDRARDEAASPAVRADQLADEIARRIDDPDTDPWVYERLAWAVVHGHLPARELRSIVRYVERQAEEGKLRRSGGALLNALGAKAARIHQFPWKPLPRPGGTP